MKVTLLGAHHTETINTKSTSILVDKVLAIDAGSLAAGLSIEAQGELESILLTQSHFDHIKDLPTLSYNTLFYGHTKIYCSQFVKSVLLEHIFNNDIWPNFSEIPAASPSISFVEIEPNQDFQIDGYTVRGIPVYHTLPCMGYQITGPQGGSVFYTGDTGCLTREIWEQVSADLIVTEVTYCNENAELARMGMHLTPHLLQEGLTILSSLGRPLPHIVVLHINPEQQEWVVKEIAEVARVTGARITIGSEGLILEV